MDGSACEAVPNRTGGQGHARTRNIRGPTTSNKLDVVPPFARPNPTALGIQASYAWPAQCPTAQKG
jgi:hypothetical protein